MIKEDTLNTILLVGILCFFIGIGIIVIELGGAYKYCKSQDGNYKLDLNGKEISHLCNGLEISRYENFDGKVEWDFSKNYNFTIIFPNTSE